MFSNKFGIEIEFLGMGSCTGSIAHNLGVKRGLPVEECGGEVSDVWLVKEDGSVEDDGVYCEWDDDGDGHQCGDCDNCYMAKGAEIVSPPMYYNQDSLDEIKLILAALNKAGGYVNETCGLHVHVDASFLHEYTLEDKRRFFKHIRSLYAKYEDAFDARIHSNRRKDRNHYCRTMKWADCDPRDSNVAYDSSRYVKLNTHSFTQHGTIEFRHHHGTLKSDEVINWVKTCLIFIQYARDTFATTDLRVEIAA